VSLPRPTTDVPMDRDLKKLAPGFRRRVELVLADLVTQGFDPMVVEAFRTDARQRHLFGFGRTYDDGRGVVTKASDASRSMHGYGLAVDIVSKSKMWNAGDKFWNALAATAEKHGCVAGLRWKMRDSPHIQMGGTVPQSPNAAMIASRAANKTPDVWRRFGVDS
jgi:peptidoglycan LD-endopeptidase CwlK